MSIASELQDKINAKAAIKASIEAKGVTVGDVKLNQYAAKVDAIAQDPTIPVGTGQHLVTFYDFDGKVLKRQRVNTGENATAPATHTHQYLTFAEWNNPFTNVQSDIDTGAIYNTTDGKTYLFITLTPVTGLAPTLYFSKSSTSLMTIDWGDGTTSTSTTSGNQSINHVYATAGDYIITVDNSAGGTLTIGQGAAATGVFSNGSYKNSLLAAYVGANTNISSYSLQSDSLYKVSIPNTAIQGYVFAVTSSSLNILISYSFGSPASYSAKKRIIKNGRTELPNLYCYFLYGLSKIIIPSSVNTIGDQAFQNCLSLKEILLLSTTPPSLVNINAFTGINPICKIYVPDASVNAYKTATNWVTYAKYIYPLSQKPQSNE